VKKHTTVTITRKMLEELGACGEGLQFLEVVCGNKAKISTDPVANMDLALDLVDWHLQHDWRWGHAAWLAEQVLGESYTSGVTIAVSDIEDLMSGHDAFQVAQQLAWVADALATKAGR
jgi:hypothetical protein